MTVQELIEELLQHDRNAKVLFDGDVVYRDSDEGDCFQDFEFDNVDFKSYKGVVVFNIS